MCAQCPVMERCPILNVFPLCTVPRIGCGSTVTLTRMNCFLKMNKRLKTNNKNAFEFEALSREAC